MHPFTHYYDEVLKFRQTGNIRQPDPVLHDKLIAEELMEFHEAVTDKDLADAIGDRIVTCMGKAIDVGVPHEVLYLEMTCIMRDAKTCGIDAKEAFRLVMESNYSKFVKDDEIDGTRHKYKQIGVEVYFTQCEPGLSVVYSAFNQKGNDGKDYPKDKFLKSVNFFEPRFDEDDSWMANKEAA